MEKMNLPRLQDEQITGNIPITQKPGSRCSQAGKEERNQARDFSEVLLIRDEKVPGGNLIIWKWRRFARAS